MKKFYLGALGCLLAMGASAQVVNPTASIDGYFYASIGKEFTNLGKSFAYTIEGKDGGVLNIRLYKEGFEEFHSLNINPGNEEGFTIPIIDLDRTSIFDADNEYLLISQSLFNNDDKFEYVRFVSNPEDAYKTKAFEIVNEDNDVLAEIDCPANSERSYPRILKWGDNYYFAIYSRNKDYTYFWDIYHIEKSTNSIRKVNAAPLMSVMPVLAERNSTVNVTLDAETAKNGGELIITDSNGRTIGRSYVEAGQTSVPVTTDRMCPGVYNITLTEKGQKVENARIIVK